MLAKGVAGRASGVQGGRCVHAGVVCGEVRARAAGRSVSQRVAGARARARARVCFTTTCDFFSSSPHFFKQFCFVLAAAAAQTLSTDEVVSAVREASGPEGSRDVEVLGETTLSEDGSFFALVPHDTPLLLDLLGAEGEVLVRGATPFWVRPNEVRGCVGCHEDPETALRALRLRREIYVQERRDPGLLSVLDRAIELLETHGDLEGLSPWEQATLMSHTCS